MLMAMVTHVVAVASIPKLFHTNNVPGARDREKSDIVLEKTLESPLQVDQTSPCRQILYQLSYQGSPKGNQCWIFIGSTDAKAEASILWPPDEKNWLTGKDPDAGKNWRQQEKGTTEDEIVGWHHRLDGHEFDQPPEVGDGQGTLACYSPQGCKELEMMERLNGTELMKFSAAPSLGYFYLSSIVKLTDKLLLY